MTDAEQLREWLEAAGFRIANNFGEEYNRAKWYAYRPSEIPARECECNENKRLQIVVRPFVAVETVSAVVEVCGEYGGIWHKLVAYGLSFDELRARLPEIERQLVAAWNALGEAKP